MAVQQSSEVNRLTVPTMARLAALERSVKTLAQVVQAIVRPTRQQNSAR